MLFLIHRSFCRKVDKRKFKEEKVQETWKSNFGKVEEKSLTLYCGLG